ncbi:MAG TPA: polysaccharide deacetylase family protein [Puia sp.]|jgi:peptidoglycan/xylan/chitin deacetylase (PgdA/CDA1 family)|nr:polysaccharide deacetylase family protein [Puia sp.]
MVKSLFGKGRRYFFNLVDTPAVILLYHRVTRLEHDPQQLSVDPDNFYDQVQLLKRDYALLNIGEFTDLVSRRRRLPKRSVILTFDDGYADNLLEAVPILANLDRQALFYITTSNIGTSYELWWDQLERIFLMNAVLPPVLEIRDHDRQLRLQTASAEERLASYYQCHWFLKYTRPDQRNEIIDNLLAKAALGKEGRATHRLMTWDELKDMGHSTAAVVGAHTHHHPVLSLLSYPEQAEEIKTSTDILEKVLHRKIEHFSYPYGMRKDMNADSIRICRESGFRIVCSNFYGQVHSWSNPMRLPRILVRNWEKQEFGRQLSKFFSY